MEKFIADIVRYNLWANSRLVNWLASNDQKLLTKECHSSFPTVFKTLDHIWDGQVLYYSVLNNKTLEKNWNETIDGLFKGLISQSKEFLDYVVEQNSNSLSEKREVKIKKLSGFFSQYELIQHCMNHSTFHRGQLITMGHQLGLNKAPSTDLLFYAIERKMIKTS